MFLVLGSTWLYLARHRTQNCEHRTLDSAPRTAENPCNALRRLIVPQDREFGQTIPWQCCGKGRVLGSTGFPPSARQARIQTHSRLAVSGGGEEYPTRSYARSLQGLPQDRQTIHVLSEGGRGKRRGGFETHLYGKAVSPPPSKKGGAGHTKGLTSNSWRGGTYRLHQAGGVNCPPSGVRGVVAPPS